MPKGFTSPVLSNTLTVYLYFCLGTSFEVKQPIFCYTCSLLLLTLLFKTSAVAQVRLHQVQSSSFILGISSSLF